MDIHDRKALHSEALHHNFTNLLLQATFSFTTPSSQTAAISLGSTASTKQPASETARVHPHDTDNFHHWHLSIAITHQTFLNVLCPCFVASGSIARVPHGPSDELLPECKDQTPAPTFKKKTNTKPQTKHPSRFYFSSIYGYRVELTFEVTSQFVAGKHRCRFQPWPLIISSFLLSQKAAFTRVRHRTFTGSIVS